MIQTANLELSKRLHELAPGWDSDLDHIIYRTEKGRPVVSNAFDDRATGTMPAYDLEWLLRKLPAHIEKPQGLLWPIQVNFLGTAEAIKTWQFTYPFLNEGKFCGTADSPEDAACALLIKLIEEGIVTP